MSQNSLTTYQASTKYLYSEIDSEAVILDINSGTYYGLNDVSNQIWQWLQTPASQDKLLGLLLEEYDVSSEEASADLERLLREMVSTGLIEVVNEKAVQVS